MGYFYPPPPTFIGGKQPYAPPLGIVQSGPVPQAPPLRGAIALATFGVILSSWQPPFFQAQGAGDIAPTIQAPAGISQPPVPCKVNLSTIIRAWEPLPFTIQGAGDIAPIIPAVAAPSQPPVMGRAMQSILQSTWQFGATTQIALSSIAPFITTTDQPPAPSGTNLLIAVQAWQAPPFFVQGAGDIAPSLPIVSQPQLISSAQRFAIRATWDAPWSAAYMQGAGDIAPIIPAPAAASQPLPVNTIVQALIRDSWSYDPITVVSLASIAPFIAQADQPPVPSSIVLQTVLQWWVPPFALPPRLPGVATQPRVDLPPVNTDSLFNELVAANQPPPYAIPKAATIASWLPPAGVPSQPQPVSAVTLNLIVRSWDPPVWWPLPDNGPIAQTATVVNAPPASSPSQFYALVAASQPPFVLPPTGEDFAPLLPGPATPPPVPNLALARLLVQSWDVPAPTRVPRALPTRSGPLPDPPPPSSRVNLQTIVQANQPPWNYGQGFGFIAAYPVYVPLILVGSPRYVIRHLRARRFTVSATTYLQFEPLDPAESVELIFDFAPDLPSGIIIAGPPQITITLKDGTDSNPDGIRNGTVGVDVTSTQVIMPVKGALDGNKYSIKIVQATTDPELVLALTGILQMVEGA